MLLIITNCKTKQLPIEHLNKPEYEFIEMKNEFKFKLVEFHKNTTFCYTEIVPYALLIRELLVDSLPKKISVLSHCDHRAFQVGDT